MKMLKNNLSFVLTVGLILLPIVSYAQVNSDEGSNVSSENSTSEEAVDGYCPVCIMKGELVKGNSRYSATYKGKKYLFDTNEDKRMFLENPELYTQGLNLKYQQMKK